MEKESNGRGQISIFLFNFFEFGAALRKGAVYGVYGESEVRYIIQQGLVGKIPDVRIKFIS